MFFKSKYNNRFPVYSLSIASHLSFPPPRSDNIFFETPITIIFFRLHLFPYIFLTSAAVLLLISRTYEQNLCANRWQNDNDPSSVPLHVYYMVLS